jgi:predicted dehydrogenase
LNRPWDNDAGLSSRDAGFSNSVEAANEIFTVYLCTSGDARSSKTLVAQGYVGKVRSARMHVSVNMFGEIRANAVRWSLPIENFISVVAIFGGHFFPVLFSLVGKPSSFERTAPCTPKSAPFRSR